MNFRPSASKAQDRRHKFLMFDTFAAFKPLKTNERERECGIMKEDLSKFAPFYKKLVDTDVDIYWYDLAHWLGEMDGDDERFLSYATPKPGIDLDLALGHCAGIELLGHLDADEAYLITGFLLELWFDKK